MKPARVKSAVTIVGCALILSSLAWARQRGAAEAPPQSASISGTVLRLGTNEGVFRARVLLAKIGGQLTDYKTAVTDESGAFLISGVAPGRYRVYAEREGYLLAEHGQSNAIRPLSVDAKSSAPVTLEAGQQMKGLQITLTPTGAIAGRVLDSDGFPARNFWVDALQPTYPEGERRLSPVKSAQTDDLGDYRIFGLAPGAYFIGTSPPALPRIEGEVYIIPGAESRSTNSRQPVTRMAGTDALAAGAVDTAAFSSGLYPTTYRPGTTDIAAAIPIDLRAGATVSGIDLRVERARTARVSGRVVGAAAQPVEGVTVSLAGRAESSVSQSTRSQGGPNAGVFDFPEVAPGTYDLQASTQGLRARIAVHVGVEDVENLTVVVQPSVAIRGRITIEGRPDQNDSNLAGMYIGLVPGYRARAGSDGTFTIGAVTPGEYRLVLDPASISQNYYVQSARLGSIDALDGVFQLDAQPNTQLDVLMRSNGAILEGMVVDTRQNPVKGSRVVVVPNPALRKRSDLYRTAVTDAAGRARIEGIAPGEYKVFAWEVIEENAWRDDDVMRVYESQGAPVRLMEGERQDVQVKVISPPL